MNFTPEQKLEAEVKLKEILGKVAELLIVVQKIVVANTPNKVDDMLSPVVEPMEVEGLKKLIEGLKL